MSLFHGLVAQGSSGRRLSGPSLHMPMARVGQTAYLVGIGSSIDRGNPHGPANSWQRYCADILGVTYAATGIDGGRTDQIRANITENLLDYKPSIAVIGDLINDEDQGRDMALAIADIQFMIEAALADGIPKVYFRRTLPWTNGTNLQNQHLDAANATIIAWIAAEHPEVKVLDARAIVGQFRIGGDPNNLWDIQPAKMQIDGFQAHFTVTGYTNIGESNAQQIIDDLTY